MAKEEKKVEKIEREYTIPLRDKCRPVPRYKKTPKSVKTIKEFLVRHMQIRDKDLKKIRIDPYLNEQLWIRGIKKPLHKVKVKVVKEGDIVKVYSSELPVKIDFKKKRIEKYEASQAEFVEKQKSMMQKAKETMQNKGKDKKEETTEEPKEEEKKEDKEKEKIKEEIKKDAPKQKAPKQTAPKPKQKTTPQRKTMPQ
jgi:large subunit ribosomal protein L31e